MSRMPHAAFRISLTAALLLVAACAREDKPRQPTGRLQVTSEPPKATVLVDRQERGETPLSVTNLSVGQHLVAVRKQGFADAWQTTEILGQDSRELEFKLEPLAGLLLLQSTPTNADVTLNGVALGKTPLLLSSLRFGTYRLRISATGYLTKEVEAVLADRAPVRKQVDLVSDSATLTIETEAEGAAIRVNGIDRGGSPCLVERIPEGEVIVEIHASGFLPLTQKIRLAAGDTQKIRLALAPLPAGLKIVSLPDKARVYVNNEPRGQTPLELVDLAPGKYRVRVEMDGCEPTARDVELGRGDRKSEEFRLVSNTGRLELITEPDHVTVFVDGRKCAETRAKPDATTNISELQPVEAITAGEHELRLVRKGYADIRQTIVIERGKTLPLHLRLERRFIPDYKVVTVRNDEWKGMLDSITEDAIRLETAPGVIKTIPQRDVKYQCVLREDGAAQ